jgi:hypothetical protein
MTGWLVWFAFLSGRGLAPGPIGMGILTLVHSKLSVWAAQKRTRLVAMESASARTPLLRNTRTCGIAAPPRRV